MKKAIVLFGIMALLAGAVPAAAAEITTDDGVLSITTPGDEWQVKADPAYWFAVSDGENTVTVDHLSNGETLPAVDVAGTAYGAVCQSFVSTPNEIFIVKGLAASREKLEDVIKVMETIKILKFDTKTAVRKEETAAQTAAPQAAASQAGQYGIRQVSGTYYVTTDVLNVRGGYSTDDAAIGSINYGEPVTVTGAVTKDGADIGWYQVQYNGATGYVSAGFLSETQPAAKPAGSGQTDTSNMEQCQYCGEWFVVGDAYREHLLAHANEDLYAGKEQCQYCGEWFELGDAYREHLLAHANEDLYAGKVQCEYCGEWFEEGNDYRNHVLAAHSGQ